MRVVLLITDNREPEKNYTGRIPYFGKAPEALLEGLIQIPDVEIHIVSCLQQTTHSPQILPGNIHFHALHVPKMGWLRTGYQGCVRAVRRKLQEIIPDIVHGQGTERDCAISAVLSGFPNVLTIHGNMQAIAELQKASLFSFYWWATKLEKFCLRRTRGVFCNSAYTETLVRHTTQKIWRVPNPLREEFFTSLPRRQANACAVLLNVGVVSPRKRQVEILQMGHRLYNQGLRFQLVFVGQHNADDYGAAFHKLLAESGEFAVFRGSLEGHKLLDAFDASDGMLHFPLEESFGLVVGEAMARGLKFFGSETGGIIDIAKGVSDAELFPVENWASLEKRIEHWLENGFVHSSDGVEIMRQRYTPLAIARQHLAIYREVLL